MGAQTYHEANYPTEWPDTASRTLEVVTFNNHIDLRIGAVGDERPMNGRTSVILTKAQAQALITDLQSAVDYTYSGD